MAIADTIISMQNNLKNAYDSVENKGGKLARLPEEYQEVEYIESTGTQYIDTQYAVTNNLRVKTKFKFTGKYHTDGGFVFGARETIRKKCFWVGTGWSWKNYSFGYGDGYTRISNMSTDINTIYEIETAGSQLYFNGNEAVADMIEGNLNTSTGTGYNIYLFDRNNAGIRAGGTKLIIYYFKLFKDDILVRDMIPCYRKSDNEIGLYDLVNNEFYTNQGTGTFLKGNDVIPSKNLQNLSSAIESIDTPSNYLNFDLFNTSSNPNASSTFTKLKLDCSNRTTLASACSNYINLEELEFTNTDNITSVAIMCDACKSLKKLVFGNADNLIACNAMYNNASNLEEVYGFKNYGKGFTEQTTNYNNYKLIFSGSIKLTHDSMMNIINNLYDLNLTYDVANGGTLYTQSLVLGATNLAKLTDEEKAIAENKGWVLE